MHIRTGAALSVRGGRGVSVRVHDDRGASAPVRGGRGVTLSVPSNGP
jgi:hypothetical protein